MVLQLFLGEDGWGGVVVLSPVGFLLLTWKRQKLQPWHFSAYSNSSIEIFLPNLVSLARPSLHVMSKMQIGVFLISGFLSYPL